MRRVKRGVIGVLLSIIMIFQSFVVYGAEVNGDFVPDEVFNSGAYKEIPVYFEGNKVSVFEKFLRKYNNTSPNANERFDISGTATFRVKAYAYMAGSDIKLGTYIECLGKDGNWFRMNWRDREDQVSASDLRDFMNDKKELSISVDDIQFSMPNQNPNELRLIFYMQASTGGKFYRDTERGVEFNTIPEEEKPEPTLAPTPTPIVPVEETVKVTKKVTEVEGEKNVWEVEMKLEGEVNKENVPTDVVIVLDRSGSMENTINDVPRGEYVKKAAQKLVNDLLEEDNIRIGIVSFGGSKHYEINGGIPSSGVKYYDNNWEPVYLKKEDKEYTKWADYSIHNDLTRETDILQHSLDGALHETARYGGTPIALGIIESGLMLDRNFGTNKIMIVLSDGQATFMRDGTGSGDADVVDHNGDWREKIAEDTVLAATQAKERIDNLKVFTIAAGSDIELADKEMLKSCATQSEEYYYEANDSQESLNGVMNKIVETIKVDIASETTFNEKLNYNLRIESPDGDVNKGVNIVEIDNAELGTTKPIDWNTTSIAITQGSINNVDSEGMRWNIGNLDNKNPAIIKYRIYMESGVLGQEYDISQSSTLKYVDKDNKEVEKEVPNSQISLSWAQLNMSTYDNRTKTTVPGSELTIWQQVPDDFMPGALTVNYSAKYDSTTNEVSASGDKAISESVKLPTASTGNLAEIVGITVDGDMYTKEKMDTEGVVLKESPIKIKTIVNEPEISSESNSTNNFIQPEGISNMSVNLKITSKSKDVAYTVDPSVLVNTNLEGVKLMNYDFSKLSVQVNSGDKLLVKDTDYSITKLANNNIKIKFSNVIEPGEEFKISMYIPSKINDGIKYGGLDENTYLNMFKGRTIQIDNIIETTTKIEDITLSDGTIKEVYAEPLAISSKNRPENKITLTFTEIANIY